MSDSEKNIGEKEKSDRLRLKRFIGILSVLIFLALMAWVTVYVGIPLVKDIFGEDSTAFRDMVSQSPIMGRLIFIGIQVLQVFIAFIPGEVVEIAGGIAFGAIEGMLLSMVGVAIGSSIIFMFTKTLGMKFVTLFIDEEKINNMKFIRTNTRLNELVFIVFFIPGTPKDIITYIFGLTRIKLSTFLGISLIARIPSILTSTWGGDALMSRQYTKTVIIFGIAAVISAVGLFIYNRYSKRKQKEMSEQLEQEADSSAVKADNAEEDAE